MKYEDLKKGDKILSKQLGTPISGKLLESPKQGKGLKKTILIWSNGEEVGMFSEAGSVYATDILKVNGSAPLATEKVDAFKSDAEHAHLWCAAV